jgi:hypothetical protein
VSLAVELDSALHDSLSRILDALLGAGLLRSVMLLDRDGACLVACGDEDTLESVTESHFGPSSSLAHLSRDSEGCTLLSIESGRVVRLEAIAGRYILTLVGEDPVMGRSMRGALDDAERELHRLLSHLER